MITLFGIKNCDSCQKAKKWLREKGLNFIYFDLREDDLTIDLISDWIASIGLEALVNRKGITWKQMSAELRDTFPTSNPDNFKSS